MVLALSTRWAIPRGAWLLLALAPIGLAELVLRQAVRQRLRAFERELGATLQRRDDAALLPLYREQQLLRLAAPKHELLPKLGLIYRRLGRPLAAAHVLQQAHEEAPREAAPDIAQRLADAYYAAGDYDRAERCYRAAVPPGQPVNPGVYARLARLILERDGDAAEAERLLRQAIDAATGQPCGALRCQLVSALARTGKRDEARWQLRLAEEELAAGTPDERRALQAARRALGLDPDRAADDAL